MQTGTRIIIVSKHREFCAMLKQSLQTMQRLEMIIDVASVEEARNKLSRTSPTTLLVDLETVTADIPTLNRMILMNNATVIATAYNQYQARSLSQAGINNFIKKPDPLNMFTMNLYYTQLMAGLRGTAARGEPLDYKDASKTVPLNSKQKIIAVASSTGGTEALERILEKLPINTPPMLIVQHMPSGFTKLFANRLNAMHKINIKEAQTGDYLLNGHILIAPADNHMRLIQQQGKLAVDCFIGTKMHGVMPAADVLFESIPPLVRGNAVGVILTGMGADGARGLMQMRNAGARTIGQNKETCVVYGMPKVAKDLGAVEFELPLDQIADKIISLAMQ